MSIDDYLDEQLKLQSYKQLIRNLRLDKERAMTDKHTASIEAIHEQAYAVNLGEEVDIMVLAWHRRAGKDEIAMRLSLKQALKHSSDTPGVYLYVSPDSATRASMIWHERNPITGNRRWEDIFTSDVVESVDSKRLKVTLKNGSTWQMVSEDALSNTVIGIKVDGIVFSEAAYMKPTTYNNIKAKLYNDEAWTIHASTVNGHNHFYDLYNDNLTNPRAYVSVASSDTTGMFSEDQLKAIKKDMKSALGEHTGGIQFEKEYMSNWSASS